MVIVYVYLTVPKLPNILYSNFRKVRNRPRSIKSYLSNNIRTNIILQNDFIFILFYTCEISFFSRKHYRHCLSHNFHNFTSLAFTLRRKLKSKISQRNIKLFHYLTAESGELNYFKHLNRIKSFKRSSGIILSTTCSRGADRDHNVNLIKGLI